MDFKQINEILTNLDGGNDRREFVKSINMDDECTQRIYKIKGEDNLYLLITEYEDSYGGSSRIINCKFARDTKKSTTVYEEIK